MGSIDASTTYNKRDRKVYLGLFYLNSSLSYYNLLAPVCGIAVIVL